MHVHGRAGKPKQLARYAKNPGKTRVLQRRGQEPNFWVFSQCFGGVREVPIRFIRFEHRWEQVQIINCDLTHGLTDETIGCQSNWA